MALNNSSVVIGVTPTQHAYNRHATERLSHHHLGTFETAAWQSRDERIAPLWTGLPKAANHCHVAMLTGEACDGQ